MTWLRLALGAGLLAVLVAVVPLSEIIATLRAAAPWWIVAAGLVWASVIPLEASRVVIVFRAWSLRFGMACRIFLVGSFFANFVPGSIGLDVYQIAALRRLRVSLLEAAGLTLLLRLVGLLTNAALAAAVLAAQPGVATRVLGRADATLLVPVASGLWPLAAGVVAALAALAASSQRIRRKVMTSVARIGDGLSRLRRQDMALLVLLSIVIILGRAFSQMMLVAAFGEDLSLQLSLLATTASVVAAAIPVSFAGLGVREAAAGGILVVAGVEPAVAVATVLLQRGFIWLISIAGWMMLFVNRGGATHDNM
ncbi:MAG: lysylphosphatidylglycerol synthase transmembrane domain-containing protein [Alphaproteobacteria bacterium]